MSKATLESDLRASFTADAETSLKKMEDIHMDSLKQWVKYKNRSYHNDQKLTNGSFRIMNLKDKLLQFNLLTIMRVSYHLAYSCQFFFLLMFEIALARVI